MNKEELQAAVDAIPYWYHRIELPHGIVTPGWAPLDPAIYRIPDDLTGKRVLDVGAWDGYWTVESIKRKCRAVHAIDDFSDTCGVITNADRSSHFATMDLCLDALGFSRDFIYQTCVSIESFDEPAIYDYVFCFGVLYHLRHPLKALENMRQCCRGTIHIETAILDGCQSAYDSTRGYDGTECVAEFYPNGQYGMNDSNWHVGTLRYWAALVEAAGFKNIETWKLTDKPTCIAECRGFIRATV